MKKTTYLTSLILFITLFFFISNCDINHLYTKDQFMALGEDSGSSSKSSSNIELKEAQLVDPAIEDYGYYTFSTVSIRKSNGELMFDGIDFNYDQALNGTYNSTDSGPLSTGYFRVVHDGVNVKNGLTLTPFAKDLTTPASPPSDQVYIDPVNGRFVLPRPVYWSKCESVNNLVNAEIITQTPTLPNPADVSILVDSGKYSNAICFNTPPSEMRYFYPLGQSSLSFDKITISMWLIQKEESTVEPRFDIFFDSNLKNFVRFYYNTIEFQQYIYINSTWDAISYVNLYSTPITPENYNHIYIVVDKNAGLEDGKSIRVFINNIEVMSTNKTFDINSLIFRLWEQQDYELSWVCLDNIKIWNHVVSENPGWIYNSGNGRENALHILYGPGNNYHPGNIQVGYFYK